MMNFKKIGKEFYKKNIIKFSILIIIIILIIFIRIYINYIKSILIEDAYRFVKTTSVKESSSISNLFNIRKEILKSILISNSDILNDSNYNKEELAVLLKNEATLRGFKRIGISDIDGNAITTDDKRYSIKDRWDFKEVMSGKGPVYYKTRDKIDNSIVVISTMPIINNGAIKGILFATDCIENLINLSNIENYFGQVSTYVVDSKGDILVTNNDAVFLKNENMFNTLLEQNNIEVAKEIISDMDYGEDGIEIVSHKNQKYYLGYSKIENSMDLYVVVSLCRNAVLANSNKILISSILLVVAIMIVTISAFILLIRYNQKYAQLEEANLAKRIFLANISHEIRTPLYGIMGLTSATIKLSDSNLKVKEYLKKIDVLSNHLLSLLNDVIDISKIEARVIRIEKQKVKINNILSDINVIIKDKINEKNQNYKIVTEGIDDLTIIGDELKLKQIILNLLINAIKYTSNEGTISLFIKLINKDLDGNVKIMFRVSDNGIGMSEEFMEKMFLPFAQEDNSNSRQFGGSGLGLSICKEFIEAMGGELIVESKLGYGSIFTFNLEFKQYMNEQEEDNIQDIDEKLLKDKNILLVEDNEINRMITKEILTELGLNVKCATNGEEAIGMFYKSEVNYYSYILMDIKIPIIDGYKATKIIRSFKREDSKSIKIIAMSANDFKEDKEEAINSGMDLYTSKPINREGIIKALL